MIPEKSLKEMVPTSHLFFHEREGLMSSPSKIETFDKDILNYLSILEEEISKFPEDDESDLKKILLTEKILSESCYWNAHKEHICITIGYILGHFTQFKAPLDKVTFDRFSEKDKEILDEFIKEYCKFRGENTGREIRAQKSYIAWAGAVKLRDGFKCKKCGSTESLHTHHVIPVSVNSEFAMDINNGITLCQKCHTEFHSKYGNESCGFSELNDFLRKEEAS